jgi:hypothetical protein
MLRLLWRLAVARKGEGRVEVIAELGPNLRRVKRDAVQLSAVGRHLELVLAAPARRAAAGVVRVRNLQDLAVARR